MFIRMTPKRYALFITFVATICVYRIFNLGSVMQNINWQRFLISTDDRTFIIRSIEEKISENLRYDKGTGCEIPELDPFSEEILKVRKTAPKLTCPGQDWVKCHLSTCRVVPEVLNKIKEGIVCTYHDIIYKTDHEYTFGEANIVEGNNTYILKASDHAKVGCHRKRSFGLTYEWSGHVAGLRQLPKPYVKSDSDINILILGFDSTAKNGFIREMPKSYKVLKEELDAVILNGYNTVGDGTPAALFPILAGKNELELPDVRKKVGKGITLDTFPFLFFKLRDKGFRTLYFEDMPGIGTFQYRFNGFSKQPADHYLRSFFMEQSKHRTKGAQYCVGDTPSYKMMLNLTRQFFQLDGRKYAFSFIADITHDNFYMISTADDDLVELLREWKNIGRNKNTALFLMGDHGPRYANHRNTYQGKLEERLPLMAIVLPETVVQSSPEALLALRENVDVLTTPHDIYATVIELLQMPELRNDYKVPGADLPRGLSLLHPIPKSRSCSEAGIEAHWCSCLRWQNVSKDTEISHQLAQQFANYVNTLTRKYRSKCVDRYVKSIDSVLRLDPNKNLLKFKDAKDNDGYIGKFNADTKQSFVNYQIKLTLGPGDGVYEASATYYSKNKEFTFNIRDISRISLYGHEPDCISAIEPELNKYCYCKNHKPPQ